VTQRPLARRVAGGQVHLCHQPAAENVPCGIGVGGHRNRSNDSLTHLGVFDCHDCHSSSFQVRYSVFQDRPDFLEISDGVFQVAAQGLRGLLVPLPLQQVKDLEMFLALLAVALAINH
jgi:hypothetical protein